MPAAAISAVTAIGGGLLGANAQKKAANRAADAQSQAAQLSIDEQRRQFDLIQENIKPYLETGQSGLLEQKNLLGLSGNTAQSQAINNIMSSSMFNELNTQGQNALLQTAAATGGLRGGNTQAALAQFTPQLLNQLIASRYANLGGLSLMGQNAATLSANAGQNMANSVSNLYNQQGAARAGNYLAAGNANMGLINNLTGTASNLISGNGGGIDSFFKGLF